MPLPRIRLIKFGSKTCPACLAMSKAKTLEKFAEAHPGVTVISFDINDERGESNTNRI